MNVKIPVSDVVLTLDVRIFLIHTLVYVTVVTDCLEKTAKVNLIIYRFFFFFSCDDIPKRFSTISMGKET